MPSNDQKVLIYGTGVFGRLVESVPWAQQPEDLNLANYDAVILDAAGLRTYAEKSTAHTFVYPERDLFAHQLVAPHSLVIGTSDCSDIPIPVLTHGKERQGFLNPYWWMPATPTRRCMQTDIASIHDSRFENYFKLVESSPGNFGLEIEFDDIPDALLTAIHPRANQYRLHVTPLAKGRAGHIVAFSLQIELLEVQEAQPNFIRQLPPTTRVLLRTGSAMCLPPPTRGTIDDAILVLLRDVLGRSLERPRPVWAARYQTPREADASRNLEAAQAQLELARSRVDAAQAALMEALVDCDILTQQDEALEVIVWDILSRLGANIIRPTSKGKDDGRAVLPSGATAVLEIKGRAGTLKLDDVRQADHRAREYMLAGVPNAFPLLVANLRLQVEPGDRKDTVPDNCRIADQQLGVRLVSTFDLWRAEVLRQQNRLNVQQLWSTVEQSKGVIDLSTL